MRYIPRRHNKVGNGGSSTEMDEYIAELEDELNKLRKEKTQIEAMGETSQKGNDPIGAELIEELEGQLREATTKITQLQGLVDEAEARATADQETILDELNVAAEKEADLTNKTKQLEEELQKTKTGVQEQQAELVLARKQIALLEETIKAFKTNGSMLPEQIDDAVSRISSLLEEMAQDHSTQLKDIELTHHANTQGLQQQVSTLLTEKQMAERKVKEQEAHFNLNQTKTISENKSLKQQVDGLQEENKRLKQKLLFLSSQTGARPTLLNLNQDTGVQELQTEIQKNQKELDAASRQLAAEVSKNQIATKRLDQQSSRLRDLEEQVTKMVAEHAKLVQEAGDGKKAITELEELKKLNEQMKVEIEQLKLHPRSKIFRPLRAGGVLGAFRERIDFTTIALKSTGSKFLEETKELLENQRHKKKKHHHHHRRLSSNHSDNVEFTTIILRCSGSRFLEDARAEAERAELLSKELR